MRFIVAHINSRQKSRTPKIKKLTTICVLEASFSSANNISGLSEIMSQMFVRSWYTHLDKFVGCFAEWNVVVFLFVFGRIHINFCFILTTMCLVCSYRRKPRRHDNLRFAWYLVEIKSWWLGGHRALNFTNARHLYEFKKVQSDDWHESSILPQILPGSLDP